MHTLTIHLDKVTDITQLRLINKKLLDLDPGIIVNKYVHVRSKQCAVFEVRVPRDYTPMLVDVYLSRAGFTVHDVNGGNSDACRQS